jgi:hypothetical protein
MDGLTRAVAGGIYSPNEARRREGLPAVKDGDEPRLQAQVVPLSAANATPAPSAPSAPSAPAAGDGEDDQGSGEPPPKPERTSGDFLRMIKDARHAA